jgi:uncharacterized membrane protein
MIATAVDTGKLFQAAWTSLVAAVGVTLAFSLLVLGVARSSEHGRAGRGVVAGVYGVVAVVALAACVAAVVLGIVVMTTK